MSENRTIINLNALKSHLIRISSEDRDQGSVSNTDFTVNLTQSANVQEVKAIVIKNISFANMFYNVPSNFNTLIILNSVSNTNRTVTITPGQYTINQFISALQTAINTAFVADSVTVAITNNVNTNVLTFTSTGGNINIILSGTTMYNLIGLNADTSTASSLVMPLPYNLTGETEVYIHSAILAAGNLYEPSGTFNVVDMVPITVPFGATQSADYNVFEQHFKTYSPFEEKKTLSSIDIRLRARDGRVLTLPNNFNFNMLIKYYY